MNTKQLVRVVAVLAVLQAGALQASELWDTVPGTNASKNLQFIEKGGIIYPPIPGTRTPDYGSDERWIIRDNKVYKALPGTNTPDYREPKYLIR
jgi:hypothetical protein